MAILVGHQYRDHQYRALLVPSAVAAMAIAIAMARASAVAAMAIAIAMARASAVAAMAIAIALARAGDTRLRAGFNNLNPEP